MTWMKVIQLYKNIIICGWNPLSSLHHMRSELYFFCCNFPIGLARAVSALLKLNGSFQIRGTCQWSKRSGVSLYVSFETWEIIKAPKCAFACYLWTVCVGLRVCVCVGADSVVFHQGTVYPDLWLHTHKHSWRLHSPHTQGQAQWHATMMYRYRLTHPASHIHAPLTSHWHTETQSARRFWLLKGRFLLLRGKRQADGAYSRERKAVRDREQKMEEGWDKEHNKNTEMREDWGQTEQKVPNKYSMSCTCEINKLNVEPVKIFSSEDSHVSHGQVLVFGGFTDSDRCRDIKWARWHTMNACCVIIFSLFDKTGIGDCLSWLSSRNEALSGSSWWSDRHNWVAWPLGWEQRGYFCLIWTL